MTRWARFGSSRSPGGAARQRQIAYSAISVLPLDVGALTSTPRERSSFSIASTWKGSRVSPTWALKARASVPAPRPAPGSGPAALPAAVRRLEALTR